MSATTTVDADAVGGSEESRAKVIYLATRSSQAGQASPGTRRTSPEGQVRPDARDQTEPARPANRPPQAPVRLTRRGRIVVAVFAVVLATVVMTIAGMASAGGAQAANHGRPSAGYQGLHRIVVEPGQTLWSIAARAEPAADPRLVVAQIMAANSLTSTVIDAGQLLWVP